MEKTMRRIPVYAAVGAATYVVAFTAKAGKVCSPYFATATD
ncbi:hypothetical protein [Actinoallomurus purpureus]|nr:hypothetical protein [Actinoallomurus purpureus]